MKKFKVIALSMGAKNKVYSSGDIVSESQLPEGQADSLVKKGFIEKYEEKTESESEDVNPEGEQDPEDKKVAGNPKDVKQEEESDSDSKDVKSKGKDGSEDKKVAGKK